MGERRYLEFANCRTGERCNRVDVTGRSEREVARIERGMLINCDVEGGWYVDEVKEQPA